MSFEQKFLAGPRLFDLACEFLRAGIPMQSPNADEVEVRHHLRERIRMARRLGLELHQPLAPGTWHA